MCSSPAQIEPGKPCRTLDELHSVHDNSANPSPTIGDIFRQFGPAYRAKYSARMSQDQLRAMAMIERCRTGELGGAVYHCSQCRCVHHVPRSCSNRHCPQCQGHKARQWLDDQLAKLLPCPYFLMTFTVPASLRPFVRAHPRECYKALFDASSATLMELAQNPKYVGSANIGITGVLHTWGRSLIYHPHVHYIVPGGAIGQDGQSWLPSADDFFVPVKAASKIFKAKFRDALGDCDLLDAAPAKAWTQKWVVNCKPVGDGRKALKYLAPYVFRVAISNRRIVNVQPGPDGKGQVTFTVRPSGTNQYVSQTLSAERFIHRFLQHVLPRGFQKVRRYGFAHPRRKTDWDWLAMLVTVTLSMVYTLTVAPKPQPKSPNAFPCPKCGHPMSCLGTQLADGSRYAQMVLPSPSFSLTLVRLSLGSSPPMRNQASFRPLRPTMEFVGQIVSNVCIRSEMVTGQPGNAKPCREKRQFRSDLHLTRVMRTDSANQQC